MTSQAILMTRFEKNCRIFLNSRIYFFLNFVACNTLWFQQTSFIIVKKRVYYKKLGKPDITEKQETKINLNSFLFVFLNVVLLFGLVVGAKQRLFL